MNAFDHKINSKICGKNFLLRNDDLALVDSFRRSVWVWRFNFWLIALCCCKFVKYTKLLLFAVGIMKCIQCDKMLEGKYYKMSIYFIFHFSSLFLVARIFLFRNRAVRLTAPRRCRCPTKIDVQCLKHFFWFKTLFLKLEKNFETILFGRKINCGF